MAARILHVIPAVAPRYGGPSAVVLGSCRALQDVGFDTSLATTDADGPGRLSVTTGAMVTFEGVQTIFFPREFSESFKWSRGLGSWLHQNVAAFDLVDVHAIFSHSSIDAGRACRRAGVPYIVRPHGALNPWGLSRKRWQKQFLFQIGVNQLLGHAAALQYTSAREQQLAEKSFPWLPPGAVIPPGVDDALFGPETRTPSSPPYVLALSRLDASKRLDVVIEAFHRAAADGPLRSWRLLIAGDGEAAHVEMLKQSAGAGVAAGRIEFRGWVSGAEKRALLSGASLLAAPSHQESFGMAIVEAMAQGVPVAISSAVDLASEIDAARAGWIVTGSLENTLRAAMSDAEELRRRGAAARAFASQFSWRNSCGRLAALYDEILKRAQRTPASRAV